MAFLFQAVDSMYPTGSYAHSFGLEGLVEQQIVLDAASLSNYLQRVQMPSLAHVDLPLVRLSHEAATREDIQRIVALGSLAHSLKGTRELRDASTKIGGQRLDLAIRLGGDVFLQAVRTRVKPHAAVVFGAETARNGIAAGVAQSAFAYQALAGTVSASMKLIRIGQDAAQKTLREALAGVPAAIRTADEIDMKDVGWFSPLVDLASARHETAYTRLFIS